MLQSVLIVEVSVLELPHILSCNLDSFKIQTCPWNPRALWCFDVLCLRTLLTLRFEECRLFLRSRFSSNAPTKLQRLFSREASELRVCALFSSHKAMVDTGKTMKALLKHVETFEPKMVKVAGWAELSVSVSLSGTTVICTCFSTFYRTLAFHLLPVVLSLCFSLLVKRVPTMTESLTDCK